MTAPPVAEMTFEQAMADLEQVVTQLERGDVALEDSIALYERGAELKKHCETKLKQAEERSRRSLLMAAVSPAEPRRLRVCKCSKRG